MAIRAGDAFSAVSPYRRAGKSPRTRECTTIEGDVYLIGDINLDGSVNSTDLGALLNNFRDVSPELNWSDGNLNPGNSVNSADLGMLLNNFGATSASSAVAVPEPAGLSLMLIFAALLLTFARRK